MELRNCENLNGCPRCLLVGHPFQVRPIDTENAGPQICAVGCGDDRASAARLRRADISRTTCCALSENEVLRSAVGGGGACALSAEAPPPSPRRMGMFHCISEARIAC